MRTRGLTLSLIALAALSGCGGDERKAAKPTTVLKLRDTSTPGKWSFDKRQLTARAGRVTIEFTNPSDLGHNVRIQTGRKCCFRPGFKDLGGTPVIGGLANDTGKTVRATMNLKPGTYWFLCANAGHWQAGQRGRLVVN